MAKIQHGVKPDLFKYADWASLPNQQGLKVLGVLNGHPSINNGSHTLKEQALLFERIPLIDDGQVGWLLSLEQIIGSRQIHQSTPQSVWSTTKVCCGASAASCRRTGCPRTHMRQRLSALTLHWRLFENPSRCSLGQLGRLPRNGEAQ